MKPKILILGEGPQDIGRVTEDERFVGCAFEGDLPRLLRRMLEERGRRGGFGYAVATIDAIVSQIPKRSGLHRAPARAGGKAKNLRDAVLSALSEVSSGAVDSDVRSLAVVAVIDATQDELPKLTRDVQEILRQCQERDPGVHVAIGLAVREIEIWMLADPESRNAAFGPKHAWSLRTSALEIERDPKSRWKELAGMVPIPEGSDHDLHHDELRRAAWEALRSEEVAAACPIGFAPFAKAAREALGFLLPRG